MLRVLQVATAVCALVTEVQLWGLVACSSLLLAIEFSPHACCVQWIRPLRLSAAVCLFGFCLTKAICDATGWSTPSAGCYAVSIAGLIWAGTLVALAVR